MLLVYLFLALVVVAVLWFVLGRRRPSTTPPGTAPRQVSPDDDADFLRDLDRRMRDPREE